MTRPRRSTSRPREARTGSPCHRIDTAAQRTLQLRAGQRIARREPGVLQAPKECLGGRGERPGEQGERVVRPVALAPAEAVARGRDRDEGLVARRCGRSVGEELVVRATEAGDRRSAVGIHARWSSRPDGQARSLHDRWAVAPPSTANWLRTSPHPARRRSCSARGSTTNCGPLTRTTAVRVWAFRSWTAPRLRRPRHGISMMVEALEAGRHGCGVRLRRRRRAAAGGGTTGAGR